MAHIYIIIDDYRDFLFLYIYSFKGKARMPGQFRIQAFQLGRLATNQLNCRTSLNHSNGLLDVLDWWWLGILATKQIVLVDKESMVGRVSGNPSAKRNTFFQVFHGTQSVPLKYQERQILGVLPTICWEAVPLKSMIYIYILYIYILVLDNQFMFSLSNHDWQQQKAEILQLMISKSQPPTKTSKNWPKSRNHFFNHQLNYIKLSSKSHDIKSSHVYFQTKVSSTIFHWQTTYWPKIHHDMNFWPPKWVIFGPTKTMGCDKTRGDSFADFGDCPTSPGRTTPRSRVASPEPLGSYKRKHNMWGLNLCEHIFFFFSNLLRSFRHRFWDWWSLYIDDFNKLEVHAGDPSLPP